ncbi:UNVERIFIED_CONTAM: hypothetical protein FKN15_064487 [Acipenser sinensis]
MHEFLRRREEEVKRDLKAAERRALEPMERNLQRIQRELGDRTEQARKLQDSQSITQPVTYLKWWSETGAPLLMELQEESPEDAGAELEEPAKQTTGFESKHVHLYFICWWSETGTPLVMELKDEPPEDAGAELEEPAKQTTGFESKVKTLSIVPGSLSLDPYETHLQFFIWKQMLTVIRTGNTNYRMKASSDSSISMHSHPSKIGVYLDYDRGEVAFYNADDHCLFEPWALFER